MSLFSFIFLFTLSFSNATISNETSVLLYETLASLKSALEFLYSEHQNINLDAVIGTRMVEGKSDFILIIIIIIIVIIIIINMCFV